MTAIPAAAVAIPFARPWITDREREAVMEVLHRDVLTHGPENQAFEREFAAFIGGGHCVAMSSCMAALHLAYLQLGVGPGDDVLVPAQTHVATAHAVEAVGARPIFIDCVPETGNIDPALLEEHLTPETKAVSLVHFLGIPCPMDEIVGFAKQYDLFVVEDCALAVGATYKGVHVGLSGDVGCFSFYPVKHLTTGDGGMLVTRHADLATRVTSARGFGVDRTFVDRTIPGLYDVPSFGLNYRMSDINAALGRVQLARVEEILDRRRRNFTQLKSLLESAANVRILDSHSPDCQSSHYCLTAVLTGPAAAERNTVIARLKAAGIGTSIYYPQPVPRMTYYAEKYGYDPAGYPHATAISDHSIALPVGPHLSEAEIDIVGHAFLKAIEGLAK